MVGRCPALTTRCRASAVSAALRQSATLLIASAGFAGQRAFLARFRLLKRGSSRVIKIAKLLLTSTLTGKLKTEGDAMVASPGRFIRVGLENELAADLTDASRGRVGGLTELATVSIAHRSAREEISMVEHVEKLDTEIELHSLG